MPKQNENLLNSLSPTKMYQSVASAQSMPQFEHSGKSRENPNFKAMSILATVGFVLVVAGERFVFKSMVDRMESYRYFIAEFITICYVPPMFVVVAYRVTSMQYEFDEDVTLFPKSKFIMMALLDLMQSMLLFIAGGNTPASLTVTLMQASVPMTAVLSYLVLGSRYSKVQVAGAICMVIGIGISMIPNILSSLNGSAEQKVLWNCLCYLLACVPGSMSILYKEKALGRQPMDFFYLNAWVAFFQFGLGLLLAPVVMYAEILDLRQSLNGIQCLFFGQGSATTDNCSHGVLIVFIYIILNTTINALIVYILSAFSIHHVNRANVLAFPLAWIVLTVYQYMHPQEEFSSSSILTNIFAMVVVLVGLGTYRSEIEPGTQILTMSAAEIEAASLLDNE